MAKFCPLNKALFLVGVAYCEAGRSAYLMCFDHECPPGKGRKGQCNQACHPTSHLKIPVSVWLGYVGDEILPSFIGIFISRYKDPH